MIPPLRSQNRDYPTLQAEGLQVLRQGGFRASLPEMHIREGAAAALVGPSGCGKTTLMLGAFGLLPESSWEGRLLIAGDSWPRQANKIWRRRLRSELCVLHQDPKAALDPLCRIDRQMQQAGRPESGKKGRAEMSTALGSLGLEEPEEILRRYPHQLSGGQAQRVLLAIALLRRPKLLLADEPTAGLDGERQEFFVRGLQLMQKECGTSVLLTTHDHQLVKDLDAAPYAMVDGIARPGWPSRPSWPQRQAGGEQGSVIMDCRGLRLSLGGREILRGIDFFLRDGELLALVGPSGSGKTSLAKVLAGHLKVDQGEIYGDLAAPAVQLLYQDAFASLTPHHSIGEQVEEVAAEDFGIREETEALLLVEDRLQELPGHLSGGERRRAALLRALSVKPKVLILDEPTASLDRNTATAVIGTLLEIQRRRRMSMILITHDMELAEAVADRVLVLDEGRI
ncbi:MAG: ABC transporter ATP-binding protein [Planctomycetota bacterium]|jgi:ABC-type glutathione transport system ATPase component